MTAGKSADADRLDVPAVLRGDVDEELRLDRLLFGLSLEKVTGDGERERIDPRRVRLAPHAAVRLPAMLGGECSDCFAPPPYHEALCRRRPKAEALRVNGLMTDPPGPGCAKLKIITNNKPEGTVVLVVDAAGRELEVASAQAVRREGGRIVLELLALAVDVEGPEAFDIDVNEEP